jgi:predicted transposase/invertase (TIGR01784 family)
VCTHKKDYIKKFSRPIEEALDTLDKYSWSDAEISRYEREMMSLSDKATLELDAKLARESGLEDGKAEGIEIGLADGVEKGAKEASINIAKGILEASISVDQIIKITGLTKEEIESIK